MTEEQKLIEYLMLCKACSVLDGRDLYFLKKKYCPLCHKALKEFTIPKKGKNGKAIMRFPREAKANAAQQAVIKKIIDRCRDFDCPGNVADVIVGPVVTEYEFAPDRFTRVKKLKGLNEDLALALSVDTVTIRRIAGKPSIGISIPNPDRKEIVFNDCLKNVIAHRDDMELPLNMGVLSTGEPYVEDLATFPHLLIGGSTGAGKSVFLNGIITSLLMVRSPKQVKLLMVDPKSVELFPYKGLPHMMRDPVNDVYEALSVMDTLEQEMRRRTNNLHILKADNIKTIRDRYKAEIAELNKAGKFEEAKKKEMDLDQWPYIILIIDEMADLVLAEKKMFTQKLACISQMARAAGICIISATQRPSVDVLPGKIKVNFPARVAFRMPSATDSKTVLNYKGAETLLGKGDMFLVSPNKSGLQRIHVPHCKREDRDAMLKISLEFGHVNTVPADAPKAPPIANGKTTPKQAIN
jgi:S-DNA-T family DNA segregation ATPase FtsK/SpoIIIE